MQREKTIQFWNDFYTHGPKTDINEEKNNNVLVTNESDGIQKEQSTSIEKEWIVQPTDSLFDTISNFFPQKIEEKDFVDDIPINILEIGCGNSHLAKEFWMYLQRKHHSADMEIQQSKCTLTATDVSPICIKQMKKRDAEIIHSSARNFSYTELNVLEKDSLKTCTKYDIILDKGCLDTFLFRSQLKVQWNIMKTLLDNIHNWLKNNGGVYIILSPRSKIKPVRDYAGFKSVQRIALHERNKKKVSSSSIILGDLDGKSSRKRNQMEPESLNPSDSSEKSQTKKVTNDIVYMYVCVRNDDYIPGSIRSAFRMYTDEEYTSCPKCGKTFQEFIGSDIQMGQGEKKWKRCFKNHIIHCQG